MRAAQLVVELVDNHLGTDAVEEVGDGEAFDGLAVDRARDVDRRVRVVDERIVGVGEIGEAFAQRVDLLVDVVVRNRCVRHLDAQLVVADELHLRAHLDDRIELDVAVLLAGGDLDLGRRDHVDVVLGDRVDVVLRAASPASACSRATSVPNRASSSRRGALPGRNPGTRTSRASFRKAASIAFSNSDAGTEMWSLTFWIGPAVVGSSGSTASSPVTGSTVLCIRSVECTGTARLPRP